VADDTQVQDPKREVPGRVTTFLPFKILGWVAGALSIVNLTKDLNWFTLAGTIARWIDVYQRLVVDVRSFLFGWIHVSWMHVSQLEAHGLVLIALLATSFARGGRSVSRSSDDWYEYPLRARFLWLMMVALICFVGPVLIASLIALLVPDHFGFWALLAFTMAAVVFFTRAFDRKDNAIFWRSFALNLVGVTGCVLIVLLAGTFLK
jgi:hypothetical protein